MRCPFPPQLLGFTMVSILFFISSGMYTTLIVPKNIGVFQFIYFFSSFWGQFGPNCTAWVAALPSGGTYDDVMKQQAQ